MKTYLVFFGNAQGFLNYYFDRQNSITDFNSVIENFDLLESRIFTTDSIDNREILARYHFTSSNGKRYSLLKLYSFAQAYNIARVEGCIFGVAILSESTVVISQKNLSLLRAAKDNFSKLSLNGLKFNKSDFFDDVQKIWRAIVQNDSGNLIDAIDLAAISDSSEQAPIAYKVDHLFLDAINLDGKTLNQGFVYFSDDFDHLKRAQQKWGAEHFPVYCKSGLDYVLYKEKIPIKPVSLPQDPVELLNHQLTALQAEKEKLKTSSRLEKKALKKTSRLLLIGAIIFFILFIIFFVRGLLLQQKINMHVEHIRSIEEKVKNSLVENGIINDTDSFWLKALDYKKFNADTFVLFAEDLRYLNKQAKKENIKDTAKYNYRLSQLKKRAKYLGISALQGIQSKIK